MYKRIKMRFITVALFMCVSMTLMNAASQDDPPSNECWDTLPPIATEHFTEDEMAFWLLDFLAQPAEESVQRTENEQVETEDDTPLFEPTEKAKEDSEFVENVPPKKQKRRPAMRRSATAKTPFDCLYCYKSFRRKDHMQRHELAIHFPRQ